MEKVRIYVEQITEGQVLLTDAQLAQFEQYYESDGYYRAGRSNSETFY